MREECRNFAQGNCRYGKNCRYIHVTRTALIDPPAWIHSCFPETNTREILPDEARLRFIESPDTFRMEWDDLFIYNYFVLCNKLESLLLISKVGSLTKRCLDIRDRKNIKSFVRLFDLKRFWDIIYSKRKDFKITRDLESPSGHTINRRYNPTNLEYVDNSGQRREHHRYHGYVTDRCQKTSNIQSGNYNKNENIFYEQKSFRNSKDSKYSRPKDDYIGKNFDKNISEDSSYNNYSKRKVFNKPYKNIMEYGSPRFIDEKKSGIIYNSDKKTTHNYRSNRGEYRYDGHRYDNRSLEYTKYRDKKHGKEISSDYILKNSEDAESIDLTKDDVLIEEFLPNNENDEFEF